ncbi:cd747304-e9c2-4397-a3d7-9d3b858f5112 [Thermothielavioides terrestris]|uniref:alpha-1,2-Mannosidase n=2 Tax=Thermothielavioides terrestris TaxID=2587410 RepID=G2QQV8_THETT|nr:glycoside hydrolase family 47 protein [Thermothielavioides terrestris NRRL 8126]AEO64117.1 glycoside hydrolase family 47 protein [Thermothielavioides terrestris NRRL 8126]SPQ27027.1 cd747304-e9c2-4397-a3d7-9d3b858f5112 [Thermothielavioides terrestris]
MRSLSVRGAAALLLALTGSSAVAAPHQSRAAPRYVTNRQRADAVKDAFQVSWDGYYKYAFPHDSLRPVTNGYADDRNGWGASAVDAFSTALVMGKWDVVGQILAYVPTINFDNTTDSVSLFETTIRYLGGLLAAHDLITGPLSDNVSKTANVTAILTQAKRLADNLKVAFNTTSGVPDNNLYFNPPRRGGSDTNGIATIGTLVLEWTRLSDLTGDPQYGALAQKGESYLLSPSPALGQPFPGLLGTNVRLSDGQFVDGNGGWGGGDDSFYEYLIKMYLYDPQRFAKYRDRWVAAADSSIKYLASHPTTRPDLTYLAMWQNTTLRFTSQHLACFNGGNFILGGLTLDEPRYTRFGLALVDGCHDTYTSTATGIGPEIFSWQDASLVPLNAPNNPGPPAAQAAFYNASGFWIDNGAYVLRPEVLESYYYAYRATGDPKYQDWAWAAFQAINATCRVGSGYSDIKDVNKPGGGGFDDFQESFWFAEVLKYSYLIHAEDAPWQVKADHTNQFVFNTEAHPIRVAGGQERA